jgi:hypothetical protein
LQQKSRRELPSADFIAQIPFVVFDSYCRQPLGQVGICQPPARHLGPQYALRPFFPISSLDHVTTPVAHIIICDAKALDKVTPYHHI